MDKRLQKGHYIISDFCSRLDLKGNIKNEAMKIYNTLAKECKSFKGILFYNDYNLLGKNLEGIVGAILYMSGKTTQSPLSIS